MFGFNFDPLYLLLMMRRLVTLLTPSIVVRDVGAVLPYPLAQEILLAIGNVAFWAADSVLLLVAASLFARKLRVTDPPFFVELNFWVEYRLFPALDWPWTHWFKTRE